jgi:ELWxxDGT repeat protein
MLVERPNSANVDLWVTNGTSAGTIQLNDMYMEPGDFSHAFINDILYFGSSASPSLWRTDGTACGTFEVETGTRGAYPISSVNNYLVFGSFSIEAGYEPHAYNTLEAPESPCGEVVAANHVPDNLMEKEKKIMTSYPNPFVNEFALRVEGGKEGAAEVSVFTLTGEPVERLGIIDTGTDHTIGQSWPPGIYIVKINRDGELTTHMVVKK